MFFRTLKKRVDAYFRDRGISRHANTEMITKIVVMFSIYILPFLFILLLTPPFWIALLLWATMGIGMTGVGMGIMHDSCHGAVSSNPKVNKVLGHSLNLVGGSTSNWKIQHNKLHHNYTNIPEKDEDIQLGTIMRFSPQNEVKSFHRFQWIYAIFLYGLQTLFWAVPKDFIQWARYGSKGEYQDSDGGRSTLLGGIILNKVLYFGMIIGLPVFLVGIPFLQVLTGFLVMHFIAGVILSIVFQLAHSVNETDHPEPDSQGRVHEAWAVHQMRTTVNFARRNRFLNWCVGGLNFQVEHHLFPSICHVHYPKLAPIVKRTAEEYNIPYLEHPSITDAVRSHIALLKRYGRPSMEEAIV